MRTTAEGKMATEFIFIAMTQTGGRYGNATPRAERKFYIVVLALASINEVIDELRK
jgi:hypothetical protein